MKKILIFIIAVVLLLSAFQIPTLGTSERYQQKHESFDLIFTDLTLNKEQTYTRIQYQGTNNELSIPSAPLLPFYQKVLTLPHDAKIQQVNMFFDTIQHQNIDQKIKPVQQSVYRSYPSNINYQPLLIENKDIYQADQFYPQNWYDYSIRCGLDLQGNQATFVIINIYPVRYHAINNELMYLSDVTLECQYSTATEKPVQQSVSTYDLVIIAPSTFVSELEPLVEHKTNMGLKTILKTTEDIYTEYEGRDKPEQIKYFIKDAKEQWEASYILLVGGLKSYIYARDKDDQNQGSTAWHVPVRYTNIKESDEVGCISDLYYSDLYRYNETTMEWEFEDWDSNGDDIFAKWSFTARDELDLIPDIYVGRLPCRNIIELRIVRDKIITYESTSPEEKDWYKKIIAISGKNFDLWNGQPDGEFLTDCAIENMSSRIDEAVRIYASNNLTGVGPVPDTEDIVEEISKGAGFIDFEGHGNPVSWSTIKADGDYANHDWHGGITITDFLDLKNGDKLPVVMVGGCHNGLLNVSMLRILFTSREHYNFYFTGLPTPLCFCWAMVVKPNGGAIASIGASGYGPASGNDPIALLGEIDLDFFVVLGQEPIEKLGEAHSGAITKYVTDNTMRQREAFTTTIFQLFGDPSLQLGGYS